MFKKKYRILVVDDSLLIRKVISDILEASGEFEIAGLAVNGKDALEKVRLLKPDALTLDVEMPVMDGIGLLKALFKEKPTPVVMVSSITYEGGFQTLKALREGAFDYVQKPKAQRSSSLNEVGKDICTKLKLAIESGYIRKFKQAGDAVEEKKVNVSDSVFDVEEISFAPKLKNILNKGRYFVAIGISTGGPPCLEQIFESLPEKTPPILVVQHMPEGFTKAMAERFNQKSKPTVKEAENGDIIKPHHIYIAPGHSHIQVVPAEIGSRIELSKKPPMSGHRPSADFLFDSLVKDNAKRTVALIMTGMGSDGAECIKKLNEAGAYTMAQDEATSTIFGMPKVAIQKGGIDEILSLSKIKRRLIEISKYSYK